jgi:iron complex outermembrane receptor protein
MSRQRAARRLPLPLLAAFGAFSATAQTPPAAVSTLPEVRVNAGSERESATSPVIGYKARNAVTATKTDTPLAETPQSITVVPRDQMVDQGSTSLQDALNYAAGVRSDAYGVDSRSDNVRIRGAYPDEYLDGLRKLFDWYTSSTRTDLYTLERIEVLRGPSSMLFGQGTTGGVINMVSKRPQATRQGEIGIQYGSFNRRQLHADFTGPLDEEGKWLYRLVAVGRVADTQVDYVPDDRMVLAPSLTWRPSAATSLTLQGHWQSDKSGSTSQFFPWEGTVLPNPNGPIPDNRFIGEPGFDRYDSRRKSFGWLFEHRFNPHLAVRQNVRYSLNDVDYFSLYADSFTIPGGWPGDPVNKRLIGRFAFAEESRARVLAADQHVQADFATGGWQHKLLAGLDTLRYSKETRSFFDVPTYLGGGVPLIDVYDPIYTGYTPGPLVENPESGIRQAGIYLQDQLRYGPWILVAGLRHDRAKATLAGSPDQPVRATSKRLAVMYVTPGGWSPYLSYSESFTPIGGTDFSGGRFQPLFGEQYEVGVKYDPEGSRVSFNASLFDLRELNQQVPDPSNPLNVLQTGKTRNKGLELEARGRVTNNLEVLAHYNYTDVDAKLEQLPRHQAAAWAKWRFSIADTPGFSLGGGVRWMNAYRDGAGPRVPSVALLDMMVAYESASWRYALNVSNLTDEKYSASCGARGDCWFGARRNVIASATYRF